MFGKNREREDNKRKKKPVIRLEENLKAKKSGTRVKLGGEGAWKPRGFEKGVKSEGEKKEKSGGGGPPVLKRRDKK